MLLTMSFVWAAVFARSLGRYTRALLLFAVFVSFNPVLFQQSMVWMTAFIPLSLLARSITALSLQMPCCRKVRCLRKSKLAVCGIGCLRRYAQLPNIQFGHSKSSVVPLFHSTRWNMC